MRDVQFDVLAKIRRAGIRGEATLCLSRPDAKRIVAGFQELNSSMTLPEHIDCYEGTRDNGGTLLYRIDERLPHGVGVIELRSGRRIYIALADVLR